jgi:hypothetical protein
MRVVVSLWSVVFFVDSVKCTKNELYTVMKEVVRRHRALSSKDWRKDPHWIAPIQQRPPGRIRQQWNDPPLLRFLQDAQDPSRTCNAADSVNFESDNFNMVVFGEDSFGASCNCSECTWIRSAWDFFVVCNTCSFLSYHFLLSNS